MFFKNPATDILFLTRSKSISGDFFLLYLLSNLNSVQVRNLKTFLEAKKQLSRIEVNGASISDNLVVTSKKEYLCSNFGPLVLSKTQIFF